MPKDLAECYFLLVRDFVQQHGKHVDFAPTKGEQEQGTNLRQHARDFTRTTRRNIKATWHYVHSTFQLPLPFISTSVSPVLRHSQPAHLCRLDTAGAPIRSDCAAQRAITFARPAKRCQRNIQLGKNWSSSPLYMNVAPMVSAVPTPNMISNVMS